MTTQSELNFLEQKARDWAILVRELHDTPVYSDMQPAKDKLLSFAKKIKDNVEAIVGNVPALDPLDNLGAIPLVVGVVGVGAAGAAITKWTYDYKTFKAKLQERQRLMAAGMSPTQAANIVNMAEKKSAPLISFQGLALPLLILGGFWIWKKV